MRTKPPLLLFCVFGPLEILINFSNLERAKHHINLPLPKQLLIGKNDDVRSVKYSFIMLKILFSISLVDGLKCEYC